MRANTIHRALMGSNQIAVVKPGGRKKLKSGVRKGMPTNVSVKTEIRNSHVSNDLRVLYSG